MTTGNGFNNLFANFLLVAGVVVSVCLPGVTGSVVYAQAVTPKVTEATVARGSSSQSDEPDEDYFRKIYRSFHESYRLGPGDEIAIRVLGQQDYTMPKVRISPSGRVYHPLVGEIEVVGFTVPQLEKKLTADFSEYIINPKVNVSLEEAQSAKVGVLGEVRNPSIVVITKPMTILEAINSTGGFNETANRNSVTLLRQGSDGRMQTTKVNMKRVLEGKAKPEDNVMVRAGDTVIVNGNTRKKMGTVASSLGLVNFMTFLIFGRGV